MGTNLYAANRCGGLEAQLSTLGDRALSAAVAGEAVPDPGAVVGVFYPDEPDGQGLTAKTMPTIDPSHGVRFLTLTNHFYSGAAPLAQGRGIYPGLIAKADMIGFDLYPLQNWCRPERLVDVYFSQRELVELAQGKPTFQWIEAAGMTCPHDGPTAVTPDTVRAESWLAIAGGAKGLGFFPPAAWTGDVGEAIAEVTQTVRELGPALTSPEVGVQVEPADGLVKAGARKHGGRLTIVVANAGYEPAQATITVPGLAGRALTGGRQRPHGHAERRHLHRTFPGSRCSRVRHPRLAAPVSMIGGRCPRRRSSTSTSTPSTRSSTAPAASRRSPPGPPSWRCPPSRSPTTARSPARSSSTGSAASRASSRCSAARSTSRTTVTGRPRGTRT